MLIPKWWCLRSPPPFFFDSFILLPKWRWIGLHSISGWHMFLGYVGSEFHFNEQYPAALHSIFSCGTNTCNPLALPFLVVLCQVEMVNHYKLEQSLKILSWILELLLGWGGRQTEWTAEVLMLWSPSFQGQPRRLPTSLPSSVHLHHLALSFWDFLFFPRVYTEWESYLKGAHCHSGFLWFRQAAWAFLQLCSKLELKGGP